MKHLPARGDAGAPGVNLQRGDGRDGDVGGAEGARQGRTCDGIISGGAMPGNLPANEGKLINYSSEAY